MDSIRLYIVSPEKVILDREVSSVTLPGAVSPFQVLRDHAPLITSLSAGNVSYVAEGASDSFPIRSGFAEVRENTVTVAVEL